MKVITIKQPWATLIQEGLKEYEFRSWKTNYRGPILIHAGKGIDKKAMEKFSYLNLDYPKGCIIASANLTDTLIVDDNFKKMLKKKNKDVYDNILTVDNAKPIYAFKLENVKKVNQVSVKGKLSLWEYDLKSASITRN